MQYQAKVYYILLVSWNKLKEITLENCFKVSPVKTQNTLVFFPQLAFLWIDFLVAGSQAGSYLPRISSSAPDLLVIHDIETREWLTLHSPGHNFSTALYFYKWSFSVWSESQFCFILAINLTCNSLQKILYEKGVCCKEIFTEPTSIELFFSHSN